MTIVKLQDIKSTPRKESFKNKWGKEMKRRLKIRKKSKIVKKMELERRKLRI